MPLDKLSAQLSFSEREVLLDELHATLAGGELSVHGSVALRGQSLERYELFVDATRRRLEPTPGVEVVILSADTKLSGGRSHAHAQS